LALRKQIRSLFGFTREDVEALHLSASWLESQKVQDARRVLLAIADRIEALLPPTPTEEGG
jgi:hypothetical protein